MDVDAELMRRTKMETAHPTGHEYSRRGIRFAVRGAPVLARALHPSMTEIINSETLHARLRTRRHRVALKRPSGDAKS